MSEPIKPKTNFTKVEDDLEKFNGRAIPEVPAIVEPGGFLSVIERLSSMKDIPVEKIEQLFKMKQAEDDRNAQREFNAAMMRAQAGVKLVVAKEKNTQTDSNYANLKAVVLETKPIYTTEGFSLMFYPLESPKESHQRVGVDIMHTEGHTEKRFGDFAIQTTGMAGKPMMTQIHGEGSAFSYGRRYLTCMIFNIPTGDDDDGNAAGGKAAEFINEKQVADLTKKLAAFPDKGEAFLKWIGAETVDTIYAGAQYKQAIQGLKDIKKDKK